jgi:hypothetical protein
MMSRLVGVRSAQRSLFRCDARLNSLCRMSTCWTEWTKGVKAVVLAVFSGFSLLRTEELKPFLTNGSTSANGF